ncbi:MAG: Mrr restriction system protein [Alphaproteobacteria bacterium]|nr:Mrr restriction system protein [Alphaproteobacteria bacterium]
MAKKADNPNSSKALAAPLLKAVFTALDEAGGSMSLRDLYAEIEKRVKLTPQHLERYEKTGNVRWFALLHFFSIDCVKAGFLKKTRGQWYLTPEGRAVSGKPGEQILELAVKAYREWKANQVSDESELSEKDEPEKDVAQVERSLMFDSAQAQARKEIEAFLDTLNGYEFQDLVAALLRGMGYHIPFVASPGKDGGTDILAYQDPFGTVTPHIRVQVKHRKDTKASREEVAALRGILRSDREIGLFVSTGGFSPDARREARSGTVHIETIDLDRFLELWEEHYDKMNEEDRSLLRLRKVAFLAPE